MSARTVRNLILGALAVGLAAHAILTGVYTIREDEEGVVTRFGRVTRILGPGIQFKLPWPVERMHRVRTGEVRRITIGYRSESDVDPTVTRNEAEWLTGDTNIVDVNVVLQYRIADPVQYLFRHPGDGAEHLMRKCAESVLTETVARMSVDELFTSGRAMIVSETRQQTQDLLQRFDAGILLQSMSIERLNPPDLVARAFKGVQDAQSDAVSLVHEAEKWSRERKQQAESDAKRIRTEAEQYRRNLLSEASGRTASFLALLREYRDAPLATRQRMRLEALERVLASGVEKAYVGAEGRPKATFIR